MPIEVNCPHCNMAQHIPTNMLGQMIDCPGCKHDFQAEVDEPPVRRTRGRTSRRGKSNLWRAVTTWVAVGAAASGTLGLVLSQFAPVFGGIIELGLAPPFSKPRLALIPIHLFVFALVGGLLGGAAALIRDVSDRRG